MQNKQSSIRHGAFCPCRCKYSTYEEPKPTQELTREFVWDNFDVDWVIEEPNGGFIRIEQKTDINLDNVLVSAGTNIDALMDYFKHHTSEVYQRVIEKEVPDAIPTDDINQ